MSASPAPNTVVTQLVETLRALAGSHPGFRAAHAKGYFYPLTVAMRSVKS